MAPLDLRYSRFKLIRLAFIALVFTALGSWVGSGGVSAETARRGPGGWIGRLLGPEGLQYLGWAVAAATAALAVLVLRRAFADPVAARADAGGVTINTVFGSHFYPAAALDRLELHYPGGQPILQIIPAEGRGKMRGLAVNSLAENADEVEAWIDAAHARLAGGE